ncbi:hypothetical protein GCM10023314_28010 [Algibacter agarivorans]|uniref:Uncharacterized protein n=1 Tax=Algibacter agarivorans TaxID=1109741 RepID=A0ABP9GVP8_9FLAO
MVSAKVSICKKSGVVLAMAISIIELGVQNKGKLNKRIMFFFLRFPSLSANWQVRGNDSVIK